MTAQPYVIPQLPTRTDRTVSFYAAFHRLPEEQQAVLNRQAEILANRLRAMGESISTTSALEVLATVGMALNHQSISQAFAEESAKMRKGVQHDQ